MAEDLRHRHHVAAALRGCCETIKNVLAKVHYIKHVEVDKNAQSAKVTALTGSCICEPDGAGNMPKCLCTEKGIISAVQSAGFDSVISPCTGPDGVARQPCVASQYFKCTCGPNCQCGDDCQCAGCPGLAAVPDPGDNLLLTFSVATALIAIGYIWAKWKYAEDGLFA
ncbi:hypothetical protein JL721_6269 [Aureococcus anophagefferens]|nr:hypothetical protein JL721_6269 [Aureococcus anophagefferens]